MGHLKSSNTELLFAKCFPAPWCSLKMLQVRLENDLAKMDFTHVTATLLRWEGCGRTAASSQGTPTGVSWAVLGFLTALQSHL